MAIITNRQILACAKKNGIPEDLLEEVVGDLSAADYDLVRLSKELNDFEKDQILRQRNVKLQKIAEAKALEQLENYSGKRKEAFAGLVGKTFDDGSSTGVSLEMHAETIRNQSFGRMYDVMQKYKPQKFGFSYDKSGQDNIVRQLFGESSYDSEAATYAGTIADELEYLRQRWNNAGGQTKAMKDYHLPQEHNAISITAAGQDEWVSFIKPLLDVERMDVEAANMDEFLKSSYNSLAKIGADELDVDLPVKVQETKKKGGSSSFVGQKSQPRKLFFKDADSWLTYQRQFGSDDPIATIQSTISRMAGDVALIEKFGPEPDDAFNRLEQIWLDRFGEKGRAPVSGGRRMYDTLRHGTGTDSIAAAKAWGNIRAANVMSLGGKIIISAITDMPISYSRAIYNGFSRQRAFTMGIKHITSLFTEGSQQEAARIGIIADHMLSQNRVSERFAETGVGSKWIRRLSEATFRTSGLTRWTESGKGAFAMEFSYALGDNSSKTFDELNRKLRRSMERYGIDERDWKELQKAMRKNKGGTYLDPTWIDEEELAVKVGSMIRQETQIAILEPGVRQSSIFTGAPAGSWTGETVRNLGVFKSFVMTYLNTQIMTLQSKKVPVPEKLAIVAYNTVMLSVVGWIAHSAKQVARGEVPVNPMESPEAMVKALASGASQGIGLGVLTDVFLSGEPEKKLHGFSKSMTGPVVDEGVNLALLLTQGMMALFGDEDASGKAKARAVNTAAKYVPFSGHVGVSLPYRRMGVDEIKKAIDPKYERREARRARRKEQSGETAGTFWGVDD